MPLSHERRADFVAFKVVILLFSLCHASGEAAGTEKKIKEHLLCVWVERKNIGLFGLLLILPKLVSN